MDKGFQMDSSSVIFLFHFLILEKQTWPLTTGLSVCHFTETPLKNTVYCTCDLGLLLTCKPFEAVFLLVLTTPTGSWSMVIFNIIC